MELSHVSRNFEFRNSSWMASEFNLRFRKRFLLLLERKETLTNFNQPPESQKGGDKIQCARIGRRRERGKLL
jgi:hypothetical protein